MIEREQIEQRSIASLLEDYPFLQNFFDDNQLTIYGAEQQKLSLYLASFDPLEQEERAFNPDVIIEQITGFINQMLMFLGEDSAVRSITLLPGTDKSGQAEGFDSLLIQCGEVISIVGPTGSGKSRLLADIEWVAQCDTPTGRRILINGDTPDNSWRFSSSKKLVAQLSQNMNFVMDLEVHEFIALHAESRLVKNADVITERIIQEANQLAGEPFSKNAPITSLSGGQSRALMIADTAILSSTPIVLIDEIENAGIDRKRALDLLLSEDKIVLMATHDPILALMANRRLVIKNGGIEKVLQTSEEERELLGTLEQLDQTLMGYRNQLRLGDSLRLITS